MRIAATPAQLRANKEASLYALYRSPTGFYSQMARTYLSTVQWLKGYTLEN